MLDYGIYYKKYTIDCWIACLNHAMARKKTLLYISKTTRLLKLYFQQKTPLKIFLAGFCLGNVIYNHTLIGITMYNAPGFEASVTITGALELSKAKFAFWLSI